MQCCRPMRIILSTLLLSLPLVAGACSHSSGKSSDTVPAAPEFAEARGETVVESKDMSASDAENAIPPEDQIFFRNDSADLNDDGKKLLGDVATWVMAEPGRQIVLEGHADKTGTADHNLDLSSRRAVSAANYLRSLNVPDERIVVTAVGEGEATVGPTRGNRRVVIFATEGPKAASN